MGSCDFGNWEIKNLQERSVGWWSKETNVSVLNLKASESRIPSYMANTVFTLTVFKRLTDVLLCSGCYIKIPQNRWLKQQIFISHSSGGFWFPVRTFLAFRG